MASSQKKTYVTISHSGHGKAFSLILSEPFEKMIYRLVSLRWVVLMFPLLVAGAATLSHYHESHLHVQGMRNQDQLARLTMSADSLTQVLYKMKENDDFVRKVIGYDLISEDIFQVGQGGPVSPLLELVLKYNSDQRMQNHITQSLISTTSRVELLAESRYKVKDALLIKLKEISQIPSILPAAGRLVSGYGVRIHPILNIRKHHKGIDIANKTDTPIHAAANGQVIRARFSSSYGNLVEIRHSDSITSLYAHLRKFSVNVGDKVFRGQVIGMMGNTGRSTGTHLHYEVRKHAQAVNPRNYFLSENKVYD